jgi:hypothetical protein
MTDQPVTNGPALLPLYKQRNVFDVPQQVGHYIGSS